MVSEVLCVHGAREWGPDLHGNESHLGREDGGGLAALTHLRGETLSSVKDLQGLELSLQPITWLLCPSGSSDAVIHCGLSSLLVPEDGQLDTSLSVIT